MYYIFVENNKLNGCGQGQCLTEGIQNIEVSKEIYNAYNEDNLRYIWNGTEMIENPNYEKEKQQQQNNVRIFELKEQLDTLDLKTIRALRALNSGIGTSEDYEKLQDLELQAENIRYEIKQLNK